MTLPIKYLLLSTAIIVGAGAGYSGARYLGRFSTAMLSESTHSSEMDRDHKTVPADQPQPAFPPTPPTAPRHAQVVKLHDEEKWATCWVLYDSYNEARALSCIPDIFLLPPDK